MVDGLVARVLRDRSTGGVVGIYCWDGWRWRSCGSFLRGLGPSARERIVREASTMAAPERVPPIVSYNNVALSWEELMRGDVDGALKKPSPDLWIFNHIPWDLDVDLLRKAIDSDDLETLFKQHAPRSYKTFRDWVGDKWRFLLRLTGYAMYPEYDYHKAFLLFGEGRGGESMYPSLLIKILGFENVTAISLQRLLRNRFAASELYRKLANIYPNVPLKDEYLELAGPLIGKGPMCSDRKYRSWICFESYAKLIFYSNKLPGGPKAHWRRKWVVIEFPNRFPLDPDFLERTFTKEEIEGLIPIAIAEFVKAWRGNVYFEDLVK